MLADSVGLALLVVLDTLAPAERLAFVLHDMFAVPFDEIAPIVERSPDAARQLASRARRRVQARARCPTPTSAASATVVDAFLAASRDGDFDALLAVLDPDVVLRADAGPGVVGSSCGRRWPARRCAFARRAGRPAPVLVNGAPASSRAATAGRSVMAFTIAGDRIVAIDILADPERLAALDLSVLDDSD